MPPVTHIVLAVFAALILIAYATYLFRTRKRRKERAKRQKTERKVKNLYRTKVELTPQQFTELRAQTFGGRGKSRHDKLNREGVYVLFNETKNKYYVGQGVRVLDRVNMHFTGKGNGDVYADYKYGGQLYHKNYRFKA